MHTDDLRRAYADFVHAARARPPGQPEQTTGWTAEQVLAHVIVGDRLIAETAACVMAGLPASFDNQASQSEPYLRAVVEAAGDWDTLVDQVERAGEELIALAQHMTDEQAATPIATKVVSEGAVVIDAIQPLSNLVRVPAAVHLRMHLEQLASLTGAHPDVHLAHATSA